MKTSTKRILSIGLAALFFLGILVVYASFIKPELAKIEEKRAVVLSKENLFESESNAVGQVQDLIGRFQSIASLQETVSLALPTEENVTGILNQVQSIANLSDVALTSFSVRPLAYEATKQSLVKRLGSLEVVISVTGTYAELKQFLKSLETNVRVSNVVSFRFFPAGNPINDSYNLNLTVETFYQE
jgi:Tfp pilus assembly protein PilO